MWWLLPPMALLLLASSSTRAEDLPKAVVSLNPEWDRVLKKDTVTLTCQGNRMGEDDLTQWWHNGILLPNQTSSSYSITSAKVKDGGEYKCQTNGSQLSDPVQLQVHAAWLLLQAQHWVVQEGDPIVLRCHSWENRVVYKVQYFQNGRGKKFFYQNTEFRIPKATGEHNGSYFCRGMINGVRNESSEAATIIVQAALLPPPGSWTPICLVLGLLFAVDTGLYFSVRRDLQKSMKSRENNRVAWSKNPEDKQEQLRQNSDVGDSEHSKS